MPTAFQLALPHVGCAVSARQEGLAMRGLLILIIIPLVLFAIWKKRRR